MIPQITARGRATLRSFILSIICFGTAAVTYSTKQPLTIRDESGQIIAVRDLTTLFISVDVALILVGLVLLGYAFYVHLSVAPSVAPNLVSRGKQRSLIGESPLWTVLNLALIAVSVWSGYLGATLHYQQELHAPFLLYASIFIGMPIVVIAVVNFVSRGYPLRRPTWSRFPLSWADPLQLLFVSSWSVFGLLLGSSFALYRFGSSANPFLGAQMALFLALICSQAIVYWVYKERIRR